MPEANGLNRATRGARDAPSGTAVAHPLPELRVVQASSPPIMTGVSARDLPPATRLLLVRHGRTAGNVPGAAAPLTGWADLPLDATGRDEARRVAERLLTEFSPLHALYSSPLERALATAAPLVEAGLGPLRVHPDLREIHCGELDGLPIDEAQRREPGLWAANLRQDDDDLRWPGGESYREFRRRCVRALREIAARHPGGRVVVVTHTGVITQAVGALLGARPARWGAFRVSNASVTELVCGADGQLIGVRLDRGSRAPAAR